MFMPSQPAPHAPEEQGGIDAGALLKASFAILRRRLIPMLLVFVLVLAAFVALIAASTPRYDATALVKVDPKPLASNGVNVDQSISMPDQGVVDTEVSIMRSRDIAKSVIAQLRLTDDPEFAGTPEDRAKTPMTPAARLEAVTTAVLKGLSVSRDKTTYLIAISFRSTDPAKAAAIANAFAETYIRTTVSRRAGTAEQQTAWLDRRLAELRGQATAADAALASYKASHGIVESATQGTVTDQQIAPLSTQLATAQAADAAAQSDLQVARAQAARGPGGEGDVLNSSAMAQLRASRASIQQTLSQLSTRYGPKHPQTQQAEQQLAAVDDQIRQENRRIIGELEARARAAHAQAQSLSGDLAGLRAQQSSNARSAVTADSLQRDADARHAAYNRLAEIAQQSDQLARNSMAQAQIIERASPALKPSTPKKVQLIAIGVLLGGALAVGLAALLEILSSGILDPEDLGRRYGVKFLAAVPRLKVERPADTLPEKPGTAYAESFRAVRGSLLLGYEKPKVITIVSAIPREGKTTFTLSLARVMAMAGDRTLLIDGDLRRAALAPKEPWTRAVGLVEVLRDGADPAQAVVADTVRGLDLLTASEPSFLATDMFGQDSMTALLDWARGRYDRILIDTPPVLGVTDARTLAARADAVVLAVKWNATPRRAVRDTVRALTLDGTRIAGAVLTMVKPGADALGALSYARGYQDYYQSV